MTAAGRYSPAFLRAIDHALAVRPQDRPQNERQFRAQLDADLPVAALRPPPTPMAPAVPITKTPFPKTEEEVIPPTVPRTRAQGPPTQAMPPPILPPRATPPTTASRLAPAAPMVEPPAVSEAPTIATGSARGWLLAIALVFVGVALAALWATWPTARTPTTLPATASAPLPATASAPSPTAVAPTATPTPTPIAETSASTSVAVPSERPRREPRTEPTRRSEPAPVVKLPPRAMGARCSDILQSASLEPLTADEAAYLKRECR